MPFKYGNDLYFCHSKGTATFSPPLTPFAKAHNIPPQVVEYQPWELARYRNDVIQLLPSGLELLSPMQIFCNPVVINDVISFVYNRVLYSSPIGNDILSPSTVRNNVYSGFVAENYTIYTDLKDVSSFIKINSNGETTTTATEFDHILRIVPWNDGLIITGQKNQTHYTILQYNDGSKFRLKVDGNDIYKCCLIEGNQVIHAVKTNEFETRHLHIDTVELISDN